MLVTVRGTYENGVVRLREPPPDASAQTSEVFVTFLTREPERAPAAKPKKKRFSFDQALALTADTSHVQVAAAVEADREEEY